MIGFIVSTPSLAHRLRIWHHQSRLTSGQHRIIKLSQFFFAAEPILMGEALHDEDDYVSR